MAKDRDRYSAGNLTEQAWSALRRIKFGNTDVGCQPTLSDAAVAAAAVAEAHPDELREQLISRRDKRGTE